MLLWPRRAVRQVFQAWYRLPAGLPKPSDVTCLTRAARNCSRGGQRGGVARQQLLHLRGGISSATPRARAPGGSRRRVVDTLLRPGGLREALDELYGTTRTRSIAPGALVRRPASRSTGPGDRGSRRRPPGTVSTRPDDERLRGTSASGEELWSRSSEQAPVEAGRLRPVLLSGALARLCCQRFDTGLAGLEVVSQQLVIRFR
jgi:hypothetical protein